MRAHEPSVPGHLQVPGGVVPHGEEETPAGVGKEGPAATSETPGLVRGRRDRETDTPGGCRWGTNVGDEVGADRGIGEGGYEAWKGNVGEVLQYWILEKYFPEGVPSTVKQL